MQALVFADITNRRLSSTIGGGGVTLPALVQGDSVRLGLRLTETTEGTTSEVTRDVVYARASIGYVDARPVAGFFVLRTGNGPFIEGTNQTSPISHDASADTLKTALAAIGVSATVIKLDGSWIIGNGATPLDLSGVPAPLLSSELRPLSFVRVREQVIGGACRYDIRLIQAPLASTASFDLMVPPAPTVTRIQEGGSSATTVWPEIQALRIQPTFRGTYQIRRGFKKTRELSIEDGPEEIAEALAVLADEDGGFAVSNPTSNVAHITFNGSMAGIYQELLEIAVFSAPSGDPTITLNLNTAELAAALRASDEIKPVLEIELTVRDENDADKLHVLTPFRAPITLIRELQWEGLETAANIDWLRPPHGRTYVPFTPDQIITGSQHHVSVIGDGISQEFTISHNLGTRDLHVTVRENSGDLAIIQPAGVTLDSEDDLTVTLADVADLNGIVVTISTAGPVSAFQAHGHTIEQIDGLQTVLDDLGGRVETLETFIPAFGLAAAESKTQTVIAAWDLPEIFEVFPTRAKIEAADVPSIKPGELPREGGLLPAAYAGTVLRDYFVQTPAGYAGGTNPADYGKLVYFGDVAGSHVWHGEFNTYDEETGDILLGTLLHRHNGNHRWVLLVEEGEGITSAVGGPIYAVAPGDGNGPPEVPPLTGWEFGFALTHVPLLFTDFNGLPSLPTAGAIYGHYGVTPLILPGYLGRRSTKLEAPATYAYDGRGFYQVEPMNADELVFYPKDFERELFRIHVNEKQLRLGKSLRLDLAFVAAVFKSNTSVQWGVAIDIGLPSADPASPANISGLTFLPPSLDHSFMLTAVPSSHNFGLRVTRKLVDAVETFAVDRVIYGATEASGTVLQTANFIVRGRLVRFDTDNHETDPRGLVAFHGLKATLTAAEADVRSEFGKASIQ